MLQAAWQKQLLRSAPIGLRTFASSTPSALTGRAISVSEPVLDRGSVFVGRAARISAPDEVESVLEEILQEKKIAKASHPAMYAWRTGAGPTTGHQGKSDGGESGAGAVLAGLLESMNARDVLVICTRWYGGTAIGPARFRHISSTARQALRLGGFEGDSLGTGEAEGGREARAGRKAKAGREVKASRKKGR